MRALVTGAGGFVGGYLLEHLRTAGDDVVGLDRADGFDVTDPATVADAFRAHRPDAVYHLAALTHVGESWDDPVGVLRVNAEGTLHVLRAASRAGTERVLVVGSAEEYGHVRPEDVPLDEDAPLRPVTPYGASKVAADVLALQAHLGWGLATIRVRPFNHTGPGQEPRFVVPALARRVAEAEREGRDELRVGSLEPVRDLVDVRDVVVAYRLLVERGTPGEVYNLCSGRGVSIREIAEHLVARATRPLALTVDPDLVRPVDVPRLVGDNTRLTTATGWAPRRSLEESLDAVLAEARAAVGT